MNKLPPLNFEQLAAINSGGNNTSDDNGNPFEDKSCAGNAPDATPPEKPRTVVLPQLSPRSARPIAFVDSPRPSEASVQRRLSLTASGTKIRQSPLRYSLSETSFEQFVALPTPLQEGASGENSRISRRRHADTRKIATTSGVLSSTPAAIGGSVVGGGCGQAAPLAATQLNIVVPRGASGGSTAADKDSPPFGRLESHPAPLHMLEQVFHAPGGGIELRQVLGIYTSKRAAEHAARCYFDENRESHEHFENMRLVTKEVPVDKAATETHPEQTVNLEKK